ncbi:ubiquitin activating enzyme E1 [Cavenderia fasciculata]|uniref:Ubiquitin activating enzyme E1 n=1 Tax=Cavenderia fasciculata TaxID=261658 RepID=F4PLI4_CACFS|nr:ubiquitin activating enzyme E1 [Cavenderia fasciculata]EGG23406.1 ubiquitin activating enzyme E1 [Cavenderia fasciculata]|eukprot:XP_004361257.1 ubiquitin activating enzyme E1 [Cavenderia fasciculata]
MYSNNNNNNNNNNNQNQYHHCNSCLIDNDNDDIDDDLYFKQLKFLIGIDGFEKVASSQILMIASIQDALTIEILKNIQLQGVGSIVIKQISPSLSQLTNTTTTTTIYDNNIFGAKNEKDILYHLNSINRNINANPIKLESIDQLLDDQDNYSCVVIINQTIDIQKRIDTKYHSLGIPCIVADSKGVYGRVFSDFGSVEKPYLVYKDNALDPCTFHIASVTQLEIDPPKAQFEFYNYLVERDATVDKGTYLKFYNMKGLEFLHDQVFQVDHCKNEFITLNIDITAGQYDPLNFGFFRIYNPGTSITSKSLYQIDKEIESGNNNENLKLLNMVDYSGDGLITHLSFRVLEEYTKMYGRYPGQWDLQDSNDMVTICLSFIERYPSILSSQTTSSDEKYLDILKTNLLDTVRKLSFVNTYRLVPIESLIGGLASQEIIKATTGLFIPINQFLYVDQSSLLQPYNISNNQLVLSSPPPIEEIASLRGFSDLVSLVGWSGFQYLRSLAVAILGIHGNASETLKNLLLLGVGQGPEGSIHIIDKGRVQKSNITKYYLLGKEQDHVNIGSPLAATISDIFRTRLSPDMANIFWHNQNVIAKPKQPYIPKKLFEGIDYLVTTSTERLQEFSSSLEKHCDTVFIDCGSSTSGSHNLVTVPHYSAYELATCRRANHSCHNYHSLSVSCIAHHCSSIYRSLFHDDIVNYNTCLKEKNNLPNYRTMVVIYQKTFRQCVNWAVQKFKYKFYNEIRSTLDSFPKDQVNTHRVSYFWSCPLRYPTPIEFNPDNKQHVEFVFHASHMRAHIFNVNHSDEIGPDRSFESIRLYLQQQQQQQQGNQSDTDGGVSYDLVTAPANEPLPFELVKNAIKFIKLSINPRNGHALRLANIIKDLKLELLNLDPNEQYDNNTYQYEKRVCDAPQSLIGTNVICGSLTAISFLESIKTPSCLLLKNRFYNFAHNDIISYDLPVQTFYDASKTVSCWSFIEINQPLMTLQQLLDFIYKKYRVNVLMVSFNITLLYAQFIPEKRKLERLPMKLTTLYGKPFPIDSDYVNVDVSCETLDLEANDIEIPTIRFRIRD